MSEQITQYFDVTISSPKSFNNKREGVDNVHSVNVTKYIEEGIKISDEDGLIKEVSFDMDEGFLFMDVLSIGMVVDVVAGDLTRKQQMFNGYIKSINPEFKSNGDVSLKIVANSNEGGVLGVQIKDLMYPSKNHPKAWATKELMYSDIITNLAKDNGVRVDAKNIKVIKDIKAGFGKGATRQHNTTDWTFMQFLAQKIRCTLWTIEKDGNSYLHLVDNSSLVGKVSDYTFFFLSRIQRSEFIDYTKISPKQIQIIECKVNLDTRNGEGKFKQKTDPKTGETKLTTEVKNEATGQAETWVLDEAKVNKLPADEKNRLMGLFMDGKINWEGTNGSVSAKQYFKKVIIGDSTREGENNNLEVEVSGGALKDDGISSLNPTMQNSGSKTYKTVIDRDKVGKLSPEKRSAIIGRIARGEITEADKEYYKVVDTTPKDEKDDAVKNTGNSQNTQAGVDTKSAKSEIKADRDKRDAGFSIEVKIYGNLDIRPRISYVLEGLGKYSDTYYLYKISYEWGKSGFIMNLTFTK
jgi:hypothetical protein